MNGTNYFVQTILKLLYYIPIIHRTKALIQHKGAAKYVFYSRKHIFISNTILILPQQYMKLKVLDSTYGKSDIISIL